MLNNTENGAVNEIKSEFLSPEKKANNSELIIATLVGFNDSGSPLVDHSELKVSGGISAITTTPLAPEHIGRQLVLMHVDGDSQRPVVMGLIRSQLEDLLDSFQLGASVDSEEDEQFEEPLSENEPANNDDLLAEQDVHLGDGAVETYIDGNRVEIKAEDEIVLSCGESSITLNKSGRITIKGTHLVNRSSGVNRVLGGTVQIN